MKTKQISDFLNLVGTHGCLFYVDQDPESGRKGGIFLIESLCRMDDKPSEYDTLHRAELNALTNSNAIITGTLGELFYFCATSKKYLWNDWINRIWIPKPTSLKTKQRLSILIEECHNWLRADKQILNAFLDKEVMNYVESTFNKALETILKSIIEETHDLIWSIEANLPYNNKFGFASRFLNYMIIRNACEHILTNAPNVDLRAKMALEYFSEKEIEFPLDQLNLKINKTDFDNACKSYIVRVLKSKQPETDLNIIARMGTSLDEHRKDWKWMIEKEFDKYKLEKNNMGLLEKHIADFLKTASYGLFQYILREYDLEESDKEAYRKIINDLFPDYQQNTNEELHDNKTGNILDPNSPLMTSKHTEQECLNKIRYSIIMYKKKSDKCRAIKNLDGEYINLKAMNNNDERANFFNQFIPEGQKKITASDISKAFASIPKH